MDLNLALPISLMILRLGEVRMGDDVLMLLVLLLYGVDGFGFYKESPFSFIH